LGRAHFSWSSASLRKDPLIPNLHDDPRWDAFLRTMGLADDQLK
jgi:hypothetical protein